MNRFFSKNLLVICDRTYRLLLLAYPASFRHEYGLHMLQVFRDCCRNTYDQRGLLGIIELWVFTLFDLVITAFKEHVSEKFQMSKSRITRWSGLALLLASIVFTTAMMSTWLKLRPPWGILIEVLFLLSMSLFFFGAIGIFSSYADRVGGLGQTGLVIFVIGMGGSTVSYLSWVLFDFVGGLNSYWLGMGLTYFGWIIFSLVTIQKHILPRWNFLPFLIGFPIPLLWVTAIALKLMPLNGFPFHVIGWALLGYLLYSDTNQRTQAM